ncbi:hypothetical protein EG329_008045 [Mollisiaceae sp. DMI_Dod_QoI]|nr:hypothetical protein EG329_008045 [Helotiales sp. DMI_Dod_QoI]
MKMAAAGCDHLQTGFRKLINSFHRPNPTTHSFKGHAQPPVNDRLETAKNFLADEDEDRFLNFHEKIDEIEEYVAEIEKQALPCDALLLHDVKVMLAEHRDWQKTVDDGWKDTKCSDIPPKNPFSNRLISDNTSSVIRDGERALGNTVQMRSDGPPFTTDREDDHDDFMKAMKNDSLQDPNELDASKNLLYVENRAYGWAMRDPAFIPYWMHPTKGIPKKGTTAADDKPWYKIPPPPPDYIKKRPDRGYMPAYLIKRENTINSLLQIKKPTAKQFKELEDLLSYHYPDDLRLLYDEYLAYLKTTQLDTSTTQTRKLTKGEIEKKDSVTSAFQDAQLEWIQSFASTGVYLIIRKPWTGIEVDLPGVFYIDDGTLSQAQIDTLRDAQQILDIIDFNQDWNLLNDTQKRQMEVLVHDFQSDDVRDLEKQRDDILTIWQADRPEDLEDFPKENWLALDNQAAEKREQWFKKIKADGLQLKFRYLLPGEIKDTDPNIIYLPWSLDSMPDGKSPNMDRILPPEVSALQTLINEKLKDPNISRSIGDDGDVDLQEALIQFAYPKLQRLLIPWVTIRDKKAANEQLSAIDTKTWNELDPLVRKLWNDWVNCFGIEVKVKMPRSQMQPETPDLLYWRLPATGTQDPDMVALKNKKAINELLKTDLSSNDPNASKKFMEEAKNLFADLQYPRLKRVFDDYVNALKDPDKSKEAGVLGAKWSGMFQCWMTGKLGHTISIKRPLPFFDPDDDPSVVYFHGPLTDTRATKKLRERIDLTKTAEENIMQLGGFSRVYGVGDLIPPYIKYLQRYAQSSDSKSDRTVLDWHTDYLLHGPLADNGEDVVPSSQKPRTGSIIPAVGDIWRNVYVDKDGNVKILNEGPFKRRNSKFNGVSGSGNSSTNGINSGNSNGDINGGSNGSPNGSSLGSNNGVSPSDITSGHYTRAPRAQRVVRKHPDIKLDLEQFRPQITAIESELEHIFTRMNFLMGTPIPPKEHFEMRLRLSRLLHQFLPEDLRSILAQLNRFERSIERSNGTVKVDRRSATQQRQLQRMRVEASLHYDRWIQTLTRSHNGVYVQVTTNPEDQEDGLALVFNPIITKTEKDFTICAPEDLSGNVGTSDLIKYAPLTLVSLDIYDKDAVFRRTMIPRFKDRINVLIAKRRSDGMLNREDSEELLDKLLGFMPSRLFKLESDLWELDLRVRDVVTPRNLDDEEKFERLNQRFLSAYDHWLDSFPPEGIWICVNPDAPIAQPGPLFFEDPRFWDYWPLTILNAPVTTLSSRRPARSRELGKHVKAQLETVNKYVTGNLPFDQDDDLDLILRPAYRHIAQRVRTIVYTSLKVQPDQLLRPEQHVLAETTLELAYLVWKYRLREDANASTDNRIRIVEFSPGRYHTYYGTELPSQNNLTDPYPRDFEADCDIMANDIFDPIWQLLEATRDMFISLASRVRNQSRLTPDETAFLNSNLYLATKEDQRFRETAAAAIISKQTLSTKYNELLQHQYQMMLLKRWARMYPDIVGPAASMPLLRTVDRLISRSLPGESPRIGVPEIATPSQSEIRQLEVEINNLLDRERKNTLQQREKDELDFLLRALLPGPLQTLKMRLDKLHQEFVTLPGLTMNESMQFVAYRQQYQQQFAEFKQSIPRRGIFLDTWWYTAEAIAEACSRARLWKEAAEKDGAAVTYPVTADSLEDLPLSVWHGLYHDLSEYLSTSDEDPDIETRLLFHAMPAALVTLKQELKNFKALANNNSSTNNENHMRESAWVEDGRRRFIRSWTEWITSLPLSELQPLRTGARQNLGGGRGGRGSNLGPNTGGEGNLGSGGGLNSRGPVNFSSKAERRGIKRAAIELALNLLATNQEQHRPLDIYRILDLPGEYEPLDEGTPLCLPLEPHQRPVELDTFHYTKRLTAYHQATDTDYSLARAREENERPSEVPIPANYNGPFAQADEGDLEDAKRKWIAQLAQIIAQLQHANLDAPRPLLQELLMCYASGSNANRDNNNPLDQGVPLTVADVNLLSELAEPSWDEIKRDYPILTSDTLNYATSLAQQTKDKDFEAELDALDWHGKTWLPAGNRNTQDPYAQRVYDGTFDSVQGYSIKDLAHEISTARLRKANAAGLDLSSPLCSEVEATTCLNRLKALRRIHVNRTAPEPLDTLVAKIPLNGHPENKYIVSRQAATRSAGVFLDTAKSEYQVQYDASGKKGPPIVQPNKYEHLRSIAYRIGRDIHGALSVRSTGTTTKRQFVTDQWRAMTDTRATMIANQTTQTTRSLQDMALELNKIAPDLANDNGIRVGENPPTIDEKEAAMLLQMQMVEEISNCWEPRFPENERLWDFANDRVAPQTRTMNGREVQARRRITQFFDVKRFPPGCQNTATRTAIAKSGPQVQTATTPATATEATTKTDTVPIQQIVAQQQAEALKKKTRHIRGQQPNFPFGETPYQQAYQSFCMEYDLRDVPEFQPTPAPRSGLFAKSPSPEPIDRYALPEIPPGWEPDNISTSEKRAQLIEAAKRLSGFPDSNILELYHTPEEIAAIKLQEAFQKHQSEIEVANDAIAQACNKPFAQVTPQEYSAACDRLGIDKQTGKFIKSLSAHNTGTHGNSGNMPPPRGGRRGGGGIRPNTPGPINTGGSSGADDGGQRGPLGPATRTRSKSPAKTDRNDPGWTKFVPNWFNSGQGDDEPPEEAPGQLKGTTRDRSKGAKSSEDQSDLSDEDEETKKVDAAKPKKKKEGESTKRSGSPSKRTSPRKKAKS